LPSARLDIALQTIAPGEDLSPPTSRVKDLAGPFRARDLHRNHYRRGMKGTLKPAEDPSREVWREKVQN
jgi:hypothetical protein